MRHLGTLQLTCADSDGTDKLLSPAAAPHHQSQVCLFDQLVHGALQTATNTKKTKVKVSGHTSVYRYKIYSNKIETVSQARDTDELRCY